MDTAEMRLLTVPQFARRVSRSVDEVLALIANRDVKALRPDPEGGYRVLETEVTRLLHEKTTRIKHPVKAEGAPKPATGWQEPGLTQVPSYPPQEYEPTPARAVKMEVHLTVVTALETAKVENSRLERLNSTLQAELFQYRRLYEDERSQLLESRARLDSAQQQLCAAKLESIEVERRSMEAELALAKRLAVELEAAQRDEAQQAAGPAKTWWQRFFG